MKELLHCLLILVIFWTVFLCGEAMIKQHIRDENRTDPNQTHVEVE